MKKTILFLAVLCMMATEASTQMTKVACIGDYGDGNQAELDVSNLVHSWNPEAIITLGDNNYPSGGASTIDGNIGAFYQDYIWPYDCNECNSGSGSPTGTNRFWPSLGNHDWEAASSGGFPQPYLDYFELPGNERWYDFVVGDAHFFVIDSDPHEDQFGGRYHLDLSNEQPQWLKDELAASTSTWNIVYFHHPPYTSSEAHGPESVMQWPFEEWGADAVLAGHNHHYERLEVDGIPYFVNGAGGREYLHDFTNPPAPESEFRYNDDHGAMLFEYDAQSLVFKFINTSGVTIDTYTMGAGSNCSPNFTPNNPNLPQGSGSTSIAVNGISGGWSVNASENWLTVSNSNDTDINVSYTANNNTSSRSATITVTCANGSQSAPITVTQAGTSGGGPCQIITIDGNMFYNEDGSSASGNQWANALGDEQAVVGTPVGGQTNSQISTTWQYPWDNNNAVQSYIELPQAYTLETIWLIDGWGTGTFTVAEGLPSDGHQPFISFSTSEGLGYIHEFAVPAGMQTQHLTFTRLTPSAKITEVVLCGSTGTPPPTCTPTFSPSSLNLSSGSGSTTIGVSGVSGGWSVNASQSWLTVSNSNDSDIAVSYTANNNASSRSATITFTCANGLQSNPITVTQGGAGGGPCQIIAIDGNMFYNEDGSSASGNQWANALGDEQAVVGTPVGGQTNSQISTTWQYPWDNNNAVQSYIELPQAYTLETIWLIDGWGTGTFTVAEGLPSDGHQPFISFSTSEGLGYIHEFAVPAGMQTQYLTFTRLTPSAKITEVVLCGSTGTPPPTCTPNFTPGTLSLSEAGGSANIAVSGIGSGWSVNASASWLTVSNSNDTDITVSYTANGSGSSRSATITLTCANGVQANPVTVTQSGTTAGGDLIVTVTPSTSQITPSQVFTSSLKVKNNTSSAISSITVDCVDMNYNHSTGSGNAFTLENHSSLSPSHGNYNWWTAQWTLGTLNPGEEATLDFDFKIKSSSSCQPGILMAATATESGNDYDGSNTVDCTSSFGGPTPTKERYDSQQEFFIYPNPAKDQLQLILNNKNATIVKFAITDQLGKQIKLDQTLISNGDQSYTLDVSSLAAGIYFISVESNDVLTEWLPVKFVKSN